MEAPRSLLRHHGLTLLLTLGIVYVFVTGTLPALADRAEIRARRAEVEADIERLSTHVELLREWNDAAESDPITQERLRERWRLAPDAAGYRQLPDPDPASAADSEKSTPGETGGDSGAAHGQAASAGRVSQGR